MQIRCSFIIWPHPFFIERWSTLFLLCSGKWNADLCTKWTAKISTEIRVHVHVYVDNVMQHTCMIKHVQTYLYVYTCMFTSVVLSHLPVYTVHVLCIGTFIYHCLFLFFQVQFVGGTFTQDCAWMRCMDIMLLCTGMCFWLLFIYMYMYMYLLYMYKYMYMWMADHLTLGIQILHAAAAAAAVYWFLKSCFLYVALLFFLVSKELVLSLEVKMALLEFGKVFTRGAFTCTCTYMCISMVFTFLTWQWLL